MYTLFLIFITQINFSQPVSPTGFLSQIGQPDILFSEVLDVL